MTTSDEPRKDEPAPPPTPFNWAETPTGGLSSPGSDFSAPAGDPGSIDDFFQLRADGEPDTVFDEHEGAAPRREMKISREHRDGRLSPGHVINERFEVRACLGGGPVGTVYLVNDLRLKEKKALKLMHPALIDSDDAARRFIAELTTLQRLSHEYIVRVYDYGTVEDTGLSFFTMEYIDGVALRDFLKKKGGKLPLDKALPLFLQILDALEYAHQRTTHRNLNPVNIMVSKTGKVVLLNFGISTTTSSTGIAAAQQQLGTTYYLAPEQRAYPELDEKRVDIYAAGIILYQMLTGTIPLEEPLSPSRLAPAIPRALDKVIMRCLAPNPKERFEDARAVKRAIETAMQRRRDMARVIGAIFLLAAVIGLIWFLSQPG